MALALPPLQHELLTLRLRPAGFTALEVAPTLSSAAARASPLRAPPLSFAPSQPRAADLESENSTCDFCRAHSADEILGFIVDPVFQ